MLDQAYIEYVDEAAIVCPFVSTFKRFREDVASHCVCIFFHQVIPAFVERFFESVDRYSVRVAKTSHSWVLPSFHYLYHSSVVIVHCDDNLFPFPSNESLPQSE